MSEGPIGVSDGYFYQNLKFLMDTSVRISNYDELDFLIRHIYQASHGPGSEDANRKVITPFAMVDR